MENIMFTVQSEILATFKAKIYHGNLVLLMDHLYTTEDDITPHHLPEDTFFLQEYRSSHIDTYTGEWIFHHQIELKHKVHNTYFGSLVEHVETVFEYPVKRVEANLDELQEAIEYEKQQQQIDDSIIF